MFKKFSILFVLFVLPIVTYLFFASGVNNFGKLSVLTPTVGSLGGFYAPDGEVTFDNSITMLAFLGDNIEIKKANASNLLEKIFKKNREFEGFQVVLVPPVGQEAKAAALKEQLGQYVDVRNFHFVFGTKSRIQTLFNSLKTNLQLDDHMATKYAFVIDRDSALRGRTDDEDIADGVLYGYNTESVAELGDKMKDDVAILLAEYRLALRSNGKSEDRRKEAFKQYK